MKKTELKSKIINGSFWTVFSNVGMQIVTFAVTVILARLLAPADFGIVAISAVFTGIITLFQDLGMGAAIIQRQNIDDDYLSTSFTVSLLVGFVISLVLIGLSPLIAVFYNEELLKYILMVSSVGFLLSPMTSIHTSILTKRLEFKKIAIINFSTQLISGLFSISLALIGYSVWSLILGKIFAQIILIPIVWKIVSWRPRLVLVKKCFNDLFGYSSNLLGFNFLNYFARNLDNLIIGKYIGAQALGYYSVAYNLMLKPLQLISWSVGKVLFPVFSSIQDDPERTRGIYLKIIRTISLVTFPMMTGLIIVSEEFILTVYGTQWQPAIFPLQLLCIVGAIQSVNTTGGTILNAHGRPDITFKLGVASSFMTVTSFFIGIRWGLIGLIAAYIAVTIPIFFMGQYFVNRLIGLKMSSYLGALVPAGACSILMVGVLLGFRYVNGSSLHLDIDTSLFTFIILGIISYLVFAFMLKIPEVNEALDMVRKKI